MSTWKKEGMLVHIDALRLRYRLSTGSNFALRCITSGTFSWSRGYRDTMNRGAVTHGQ